MKDGIGKVLINDKNCNVIRMGSSLIKRNIGSFINEDCTMLTIICTSGADTLNIFNQIGKSVESIKIIDSTGKNLFTQTTLPDVEVGSGTNANSTWQLPNGVYNIFIKGEFSIMNSTCKITRIKLQKDLTIGYKMFYNCDVLEANSKYEVKLPDSMINTESMFERSTINHTAKMNLLTIKNCTAMYKDCINMKKIHVEFIDAFDNVSLTPMLGLNHFSCFENCKNINCSNGNHDSNNYPTAVRLKDIPYEWGGERCDDEYNYFEITVADGTRAISLVQNIDNDGNVEPLSETNWGDGVIDNLNSHVYAKAGSYLIKTRLQPNNKLFDTTYSYEKDRIIRKVMNIRHDITNLEKFCCGCINLTQFKSITNIKNVTNLKDMLFGCKSLSSIDLSNLDTTKVTNMSGLFRHCEVVENIDVSNFNTSLVTDMSYMFYSCGALKKINLSSFNTSNVENMLHMFNSCGNLTELNLSSFNTSKVTNMSNMFYNCAILNKLNISSFNTSNVTDMKYMFGCCKFLTSLDLRHFRTDKVTSMYYMFTTCTKLTTLYLNNFNTIELEEMNGMFSECYALIDYYIPLTFGPKDIRHGDFADTSSIKYFYIKSELDSVSLITKIKVLINDLPKCSGETGILDTSFLNLSLATALKNDRITVSLATAKNWKFK